MDRRLHLPRFDFDRYVVLAPFSAWVRRDWPGANWTRLTHLLREAGYEVVAIGTAQDAKRFEEVFTHTTALWAIDHPPEWVMDAMLGAACVIGNDSGMTHLAGLLGVPAIALHAHLPPEFLFGHAKVKSITPRTKCTFCRWQPDNGYNSACDTACSALGTIGPETVAAAAKTLAKVGLKPALQRVADARLRNGAPTGSETSQLLDSADPTTKQVSSIQMGPTSANAELRGMIAVTIGVGATWRKIAELAAEQCRRMTGLHTVVLGDEALSRNRLSKPHHLKFHLFDEFPNADTILYFDADTIFLRKWKTAKYRNTREFVCVRDLASEAVVVN